MYNSDNNSAFNNLHVGFAMGNNSNNNGNNHNIDEAIKKLFGVTRKAQNSNHSPKCKSKELPNLMPKNITFYLQ